MKDYCVFYKNRYGEKRVDIIEARSNEDCKDLIRMKHEVQDKYFEVYGYLSYGELIHKLKGI
ncbi:MAG: hypothetical protein J6T10_25500 [Methanobrevibacter sp.]|nr:hypothetical protein [Methanobrevibacter sp.]